MKKIMIFALIILMLASCSTYYGKYDYDRYFQNNEPFVTVDSEEEAAEFIARKLARRFRRFGKQTLSILAFTDEYGDRINRGDFFSQMVIAGLSRYRNPIVIERESLYEIVKERELSLTNLIDNEGYELNKLLQADYILHGRILRGKHEDMISVRCFEVGTGQVVYASTVSIDYTPEPIYIPVPTTTPPIIIVHPPTGPGPDPTPNPPTGPDPKTEPVQKPKPKPSDGTENVKKIDLDNQKKSTSDQYQYKKKPVDNPPVKKPSSVSTKETVTVKQNTTVKKSVTPKKEVINKDPQEEKKEESKKSSSTTSKKSSTLKK